MSYTIEYNRQFIRSEEGITPCWLAGDNNVWEGQGQHQRRCREWCAFHNLIGVSEADIMDEIKPSLGGYNEHWKKNGKYLDDMALVRWVKNGCRNAATIEDIIVANRWQMSSVLCYLAVWRGSNRFTKHMVEVSTTEAFDDWLREAKALREQLTKDGHGVYPIIDFGTEDVRRLAPMPISGQVRFKRGDTYLCNLENDRTSVWCRTPADALVFEVDEAAALLASRTYDSGLQKARMVKADAKRQPYNAVIYVAEGPRAGMYVEQKTRGCLYFAGIAGARRYSNKAAANRALANIKKSFPRPYVFEVNILPTTEEVK